VIRGALALLAALAGACGPPLRQARLSPTTQVTAREHEAWQRHKRGTPCSRNWGFLFPGLSQLCQGREVEGGTLLAFGVAEVGTAIAVGRREGIEHPGAAIPLLAFQDLWIYGIFDGIRDEQLASFVPYTPQDTFSELAVAPFNWQVLKRPEIWIGILATTAIGVAVSMFVDESGNTDRLGEDPNVFGETMQPALGYPIAAGVGAGLFEHVALAEEMMFRGFLQSALVRRYGETGGWIWGSILFGLAHAPNAWLLPEDQRRDYLLYGVPFITLIGSYLGLTYRWSRYSLGPPVAVHFWYDFLLTATFFALDPTNSPISARITIPF
jgi:membrane protease YdiL (CAAX protease family)